MENHRKSYGNTDQLPPKLAGVFLGGSITPISKSTLAYWRSRGTGPDYIRIGNSIRYLVSDLVEFLESGRSCGNKKLPLLVEIKPENGGV
jgi:hypothetical protein